MQPHKVVIQRPVTRRLHLAQVVDADAVPLTTGKPHRTPKFSARCDQRLRLFFTASKCSLASR